MKLPSEYRRLPLEQKARLVWEHGTYLLCRCEGQYAITLHAMENYFIEIWLDAVNHRLHKVSRLRHSYHIEPFLAKISLSDLLVH